MTISPHWSRSTVIVLLTLAMIGCATRTQVLVDLAVDMDRDQVVAAIGPPDTVRLGGVRVTGEQKIEIWEYHLYDQALDDGLSSIAGTGGANVSYWLYFEDGRLFRWGPAGDNPALPVR